MEFIRFVAWTFIFITLLLVGFIPDAEALSNPPSVEAATLPEGKKKLENFLHEFTGERAISIGGQEFRIEERGSAQGRKTAAQFLSETFKSMKIETQILPFKVGKKDGYNVEAIMPGEDSTLPDLILSAHLDSVGNAGANDDGSGISVLVYAAEALASLRDLGQMPKRTIRFVAFDLEELGLLGSRAYTKNLKVSGLRKVVNLQVDMVGVSSVTNQVSITSCGNKESEAVAFDLKSALKALGLSRGPPNPKNLCPRNSDHASFWNEDYGAVLITQMALEECYHQKCDKVVNINFDYLNRIATLVTLSAIQMSY